MSPIGHYYYFVGRLPRPDVKTSAGSPGSHRSIIDTAARNHDVALGILLMTIVTAVPVLLTAMFLLVFKVQ